MSPRPERAVEAGAVGEQVNNETVIAEPRSGVPIGAWPRVGVLIVAAAAGAAVTKLWWILILAVVLGALVVWDLHRSGGRRDLRATADGLVGVHRGKPADVPWSQMEGVEFVRPRSAFSRPMAHVEVARQDDPYDTAFVALVIFNKADAEQIGDRLKAVCEQHGIPFQSALI